MLAMVLYPEVQERAQAELDSFLKGERLPEYLDRSQWKTPYLDAIINEVLRWNPVTPLGRYICDVKIVQLNFELL